MRKLMNLLVGAAALAIAGPAGAANLILNGGFNNGLTVGMTNNFSTLGVGSSAINNWAVVGGNIDWIRGYWQSSDGDGYSIDLNGLTSGAIAQTISTVAGNGYTLTFDMSGNPDMFRGETRVAVIGAGGVTIGAATYTLTAATSRSNMLWEERTLGFVATGSSTEIRFTSGNPFPPGSGNCCWGAALDNVAVQVVPEPATWAMMIAGFGGIGGLVRRRRAALA